MPLFLAVKSGLSLADAANLSPSELALWNCMNDALSGSSTIQNREYAEWAQTD